MPPRSNFFDSRREEEWIAKRAVFIFSGMEEAMREMKPRERVLTALRRGVPDRVPWVENDIEEELQGRIMGTTEFTPGELCAKLGMDGFGYHFPMGEKAKAGQSMQGAVGFKQSY
jgi:hypothetical protein